MLIVRRQMWSHKVVIPGNAIDARKNANSCIDALREMQSFGMLGGRAKMSG
jgi:hypothetical protein